MRSRIHDVERARRHDVDRAHSIEELAVVGADGDAVAETGMAQAGEESVAMRCHHAVADRAGKRSPRHVAGSALELAVLDALYHHGAHVEAWDLDQRQRRPRIEPWHHRHQRPGRELGAERVVLTAGGGGVVAEEALFEARLLEADGGLR